MTEKQNRPREYDAVLGGKNSLPVNAAVLGGIEGVKSRLRANDELVRVGAIRDAMKYGEAGLDVAIASLDDESWQVRREAMYLLQEKLTHPKVNALLVNGKLIRIYREEFETVTVNARGEIMKRERCQAEMFAENLGGGVKLEMASIPGGSFLMGLPIEHRYSESSDTEKGPQHWVNVPSFFMGKYPVTQQQYKAVMGNNPSYFKGVNRPVEQVSWNDATNFCWLLSQKTGRNYRLPSEAEWEYACRAGTTTLFYFGPAITTEFANYLGNTYMADYYKNTRYGRFYEPYAYDCAFGRGQTTNVGRFPPNAFGLYDMHGNVWECCQDIWHDNYNGAPTDGSAWETGGDSYRWVMRGGCWEEYAWDCRSANRVIARSSLSMGFRVAMDPGL